MGLINYDHSDNHLNINTNGSERARIDSSGNVGIGTSSPSSFTAENDSKLTVGTGSGNSGITIYTGNTSQGGIFFADGTSGASTYSGILRYNHSDNAMLFYTNGLNERARIDSSGNLLVGQTIAGTATSGFSIGSGGLVFANLTGGSNTYHLWNSTSSQYKFYVSDAGTVNATNTTISAISDQRLKENIRDLDVGIDAIMALKPRKFDWKAGKGKDIKGDRGWIAQEVEQVFPDMVDEWADPAPEGEEPYKSVRADFIPVLVKAMQEQQTIIESLTARIAALENK